MYYHCSNRFSQKNFNLILTRVRNVLARKIISSIIQECFLDTILIQSQFLLSTRQIDRKGQRWNCIKHAPSACYIKSSYCFHIFPNICWIHCSFNKVQRSINLNQPVTENPLNQLASNIKEPTAFSKCAFTLSHKNGSKLSFQSTYLSSLIWSRWVSCSELEIILMICSVNFADT